jgi:hypothetical protein
VRRVNSVRMIGLVCLCALQCARVLAAQTDCSAVIENRRNCTSTLSTFEEPQSTFSPTSVRVRPSKTATVTIVVKKRPLEKVQFQTIYSQVAKPDVLGTLLGKLWTPLGGLTLGSNLAGELAAVQAATAAKNPANATKYGYLVQPEVHITPALQKMLDERADFDARLKALGDKQDADQSTLDAAKKIVNDVSAEVGAAQKYPPDIDNEQWRSTDQARFVECLSHILARIQGKQPNTETLGGCKEAPKSDVHDKPLELPDVELTLLKPQITDLPKDLTALEAGLKGSVAAITPKEHESYLALIAKLTLRENKLDDYLKTLQSARDTLQGYQDPLTACQAPKAEDPCGMVVVKKDIKAYDAPSKSGQQTATVKVSAQTLLTKESNDVGQVAITFTHQPWEVSAGIMASTVLGRSFQNTPVINNGVPDIVNGKQVTAVTDSTTKPTIDALVLVHWRFCEWQPNSQTKRFAVLGSVGVGTGTNGSGADFAAGLSFAYGSLYISPLLHFTRDQRLTNGIALGDNLMGATPTTERYWVHKFGLAFTYALPIT